MHKLLYEVIERIIEKTIPLWNQTLTPLKTPHFNAPRIVYKECLFDPDYPEEFPSDSFRSRLEEWENGPRTVVKPEPGQFVPPTEIHVDSNHDERKVDMRGEFGERGLQIIVKLANIHLTPEKPHYTGGTWHVEGQLVRGHPIFPLNDFQMFITNRTNTFAPPHSITMIMPT